MPTVPRSSAPTLRAYRPGDLATVRRIWRDGGLHLGPSDSAVEIERQRRRDPDLYLVAVVRGRVVGAVLGRYDGRRGWINHLAVARAHRSRGVGAALVAEVERRLRAKGCPKVNLHVTRGNAGVTAFYATLGYSVSDHLLLEKWLRPGRSRPPRRRSADQTK